MLGFGILSGLLILPLVGAAFILTLRGDRFFQGFVFDHAPARQPMPRKAAAWRDGGGAGQPGSPHVFPKERPEFR